MQSNDISKDLALGFVNLRWEATTEGGGEPVSPGDLTRWLSSSTPLGPEPQAQPPTARILFDEARRLADALSALLVARAAVRPLPTWAVEDLNRVLEASPQFARAAVRDQSMTVAIRWDARTPVAHLGPVAHSAALLLSQADPRRLRRCADRACAHWFLDTSKGGRRRWCSMARCGNRAKAERHRARANARRPA